MFSNPAWSQAEIFVSGLNPGKGGGFFIPSTPVLGFPGPEKTQIFSFDKNYLSRPVMLRVPSEMKAGGPFYFFPLLLPCVPGCHCTHHREGKRITWLLLPQQVHIFRRIAPTISLCLPPEGLPHRQHSPGIRPKEKRRRKLSQWISPAALCLQIDKRCLVG
jgi:hypothetical protein